MLHTILRVILFSPYITSYPYGYRNLRILNFVARGYHTKLRQYVVRIVGYIYIDISIFGNPMNMWRMSHLVRTIREMYNRSHDVYIQGPVHEYAR